MKPLKVLSVFGTRPEAVKMAPVVLAMKNNPSFEHRVCVTAQHREMLDQVFELFGITPDIDLHVMTHNQGLAVLTAQVLTGIDSVLERDPTQPSFGATVSQGSGLFDLAVNGGGLVTVRYQKEGFVSVQRDVKAPWQDYAMLPDVVMTRRDSAVTTVAMASPTLQVARGSVVSDGDGTRHEHRRCR